jgi:hypothetical protein
MSRIPDDLFRHVSTGSPFSLCLGLVICEPLCLELYTLDALLAAEREADLHLSAAGARRLRAEILRRLLLAPRTAEAMERLDGFLAGKGVTESDPLRGMARSEVRALRGRGARANPVWTGPGQKALRDLWGRCRAGDGFQGEAVERLLVPRRRSDIGAEEGHPDAVMIPLLVSARDLVETRFPEAVRGCLRRGLCLRVVVENDASAGPATEGPVFHGPQPSEDLRRSIGRAWDLFCRDADPEGRPVIRLPEVLGYLPVEGGSAALAFYCGFGRLARAPGEPVASAVTGALDAGSGRVMAVAGLEEKAAAAQEDGIHRVFHPLDGEGGDSNPAGPRPVGATGGDDLLVGIAGADPAGFAREAARRSAPWHVRLGTVLKIAIFAGLCVGAARLEGVFGACRAATDAARPAVESAVGGEFLRGVAGAGVGLPLALLLALGPYIAFLAVFWALSAQAECLVNWLRYRRWEPGLAAGGVLGGSAGARAFALTDRVKRTAFWLAFAWACWMGLVASWQVARALTSAIPASITDVPPAVRWLAVIAMLAGGLAFLSGYARLAARIRRRFERRCRFLA